ncbi:hypothetical protein D3C76_1877910 [compost metagenome]
MPLLLHVIVVAVHCLQFCIKRLGNDLARRANDRVHHQGAVLPGEILGPAYGFHIIGEVPAAFL